MAAILRLKRSDVDEYNINSVTEVNLISPENGIKLASWRPKAAFYKDGGIYQSSPFSTGRKLINKTFDNVIETFNISIKSDDQNNYIAYTRAVRQMLEDASDYWAGVSNNPVYIEAKASCETNSRYALVISGRMEDDENPYAQPFLQRRGAAGRGLSLQIERGHWLNDRPGIAPCVRLSCVPCEEQSEEFPDIVVSYRNRLLGIPSIRALWPLDETSGTTAFELANGYNGTHSAGNILNDVPFVDLSPSTFISLGTGYVDIYSAGLTAALMGTDPNFFSTGSAGFWFNTSGLPWNSGFIHVLLKLYTNTGDGFVVRKTATDDELELEVTAFGTAYSSTYTIPDRESFTYRWICVYVTTTTTGFNTTYDWYVDNEFAGSVTVPLLTGALLDSANCIVGAADFVGTETASMDMAYITLFTNSGAETDFCDTFPTIEEGVNGVIESTSCAERYTFVNNQHTYAEISHIYRYDAGGATYTSLLGATLPYDLLPDPVAVGDILYVGIQRPQSNPSGIFNNVLFNNAMADDDITVVWEYWNGAWTAIPAASHQDETFSFTVGGASATENNFLSVSWQPQSDWVTNNPGMGVTGYWVRGRVTAVASASIDPPRQFFLHPFTQRWPFLEIPDTSVHGDIPALVSMYIDGIHNYTDQDYSRYASNIFVGMRTVRERGSLFSAYINLSDNQPTPLTQVSLTPLFGAWADNHLSPTGRCVRGTSLFAGDTVNTASVRVNALTWRGRFRVLCRLSDAEGVHLAEDVRLTLRAWDDNDKVPVTPFYSSEVIVTAASVSRTEMELVDFGEINISLPVSPNQVIKSTGPQVYFNLTFTSNASAPASNLSIDFIDLILMPVDEWFGHFFNEEDEYTITDQRVYEISSAFELRSTIRSALGVKNSNLMVGYHTNRQQANGEFVAQANTRQRLWFLFSRSVETSGVIKTDCVVPTLVAPRILMSERFLGSRGQEKV